MTVSQAPQSSRERSHAGGEGVSEATLRELRDALVLVFDAELRLVDAGGPVLERPPDRESCRRGRALEEVLAGEVWSTVESLARSALMGQTRSREIWTAGQDHCLTLDVGPLRCEHEHTWAEQAGARAPGEGVALMLDVTERRREELLGARVRGAAPERARAVGTGLLDMEGRWLLVNRGLCDITGYTSDELLGKRFDGIVHPEDASNDSEQRRRLLAREIPAFGVRKRYFDAAGETVAAIVSMSLVRGPDGAPRHFVTQLQDVSERRRLEQEVRSLADHDPLTGLRNGRLFAHELRLQVARSRRYGEVAGLMLIDVELRAGGRATPSQRLRDELLGGLARALLRRVRETDLLGRLGDRRFALLLPHIDEEGVEVVAGSLERVIDSYSLDAGDQLLCPAASIGVALIDEATPSAEEAIAAAERAGRLRGRTS